MRLDWGSTFACAWLVGLGVVPSGCSTLPDARSPLGDIAPGWDPGAPRRQYMGESTAPVIEPVAARDYLPLSEFRFDEFCVTSSLDGARHSESEVQDCIRTNCLSVLHPELHPRSKAFQTLPWNPEQLIACHRSLSANYDSMNTEFAELPLRGLAAEVTVYRLYVHGCFRYAHRMLRVVKSTQGTFLVEKRLEASELAGQGRLLWQHRRELTATEWAALQTFVARANYWNLPPRGQRTDSVVQFDGDHYSLEGNQQGKQHLVQVGMVRGALGELIDYLLGLGHQEPK